MATTLEKYSKTILNFNVNEWLLLGTHLGADAEELSKFEQKRQLVHYVGTKYPDEFKEIETKIYYIKKIKTDQTPPKEALQLIPDPTKLDEYVLKTNGRHTYTVEALEKIFKGEIDDNSSIILSEKPDSKRPE